MINLEYMHYCMTNWNVEKCRNMFPRESPDSYILTPPSHSPQQRDTMDRVQSPTRQLFEEPPTELQSVEA